MQDRYVGDIGDYVKLALLRAVSPGHKPGILWWHYPDEAHNLDGRHIGYLDDPARWRGLDPELYDSLCKTVTGGSRNLAALQSAGLVEGASYVDDFIPTLGPASERRVARRDWFDRARAATHHCDLLFLDPDNGLETKGFDAGATRAGKSVALAELAALRAEGRSIIVYHHRTRMSGGHIFELGHWSQRLLDAGFTSVDALRAASFSARAFFLLDATPDVRERASAFADRWSPQRVSWHPELGKQ